jgi:hypothetical protein
MGFTKIKKFVCDVLVGVMDMNFIIISLLACQVHVKRRGRLIIYRPAPMDRMRWEGRLFASYPSAHV